MVNKKLYLNKIRIRKDNDNYYIIVNLQRKSWFTVSQSYLDILLLCNNGSTVEDVLMAMKDKFPDANESLIRSDVESVVQQSLLLGNVYSLDKD